MLSVHNHRMRERGVADNERGAWLRRLGLVSGLLVRGLLVSGLLACGGLAQNCPQGACPPEPLAPQTATEAEPRADLPQTQVCASQGGLGSQVTEQARLEELASPDGLGFQVTEQAHLEKLRGCTDIEGSLMISVFRGIDLEPLNALRSVSGSLSLINPSLQFDTSGEFNVGSDAYWLRDLSGLESLGSVGTLWLTGLGIRSLAPLASLDVRDSLEISSCPRLRQFEISLTIAESGNLGLWGLPALETLDGLVVSRELGSMHVRELPRLRSLRVGGSLNAVGTVELENLPLVTELAIFQQLEQAMWVTMKAVSVRDLTDLSDLSQVTNLTFEQMPLTDLGALEGLRFSSLFLRDLPNLTDLNGLNPGPNKVLLLEGTRVTSLAGAARSIAELDSIYLEGNAELIDATALREATSLIELSINDNASLLALPELPGVSALRDFEMTNNSSLLAGPGFPSLVNANRSTIRITDNERLESLPGLRSLTEVAWLEIVGNPLLTNLDLSGLRRVGILDISCNPSLPQSSVDTVAETTGENTEELIGNLGSLQPCEQ